MQISRSLRHYTTVRFWKLYRALPVEEQEQADKQFALLRHDPRHPSLHFKRLQGDLWSARVSKATRVLARQEPDGFVWFWIGSHTEYEAML